jgi:hypothetical protein
VTTEVAAASLAEEQLELLRRMGALDPAPCLIGGYAEDALLAGAVTRPHVDVDWLVPRRELALRLAQARELGFGAFETWGESAPGAPFYLYGENGDLKLELGVADEQDGRVYLRIHRLAFDIHGREAPAGRRHGARDRPAAVLACNERSLACAGLLPDGASRTRTGDLWVR